MKNENIKEVIEVLKTVEDDEDIAIVMDIYKSDGSSINMIQGEFLLVCSAFTEIMNKLESNEDLREVLWMYDLYKKSEGNFDIAKAIIDSEIQSKENELVN